MAVWMSCDMCGREGRRHKLNTENDLTLPRCDFCSLQNVTYTVYSEPADITVKRKNESITMNSDEEWAACDECIAFIRANDRDGLAKRSHETDPVPDEDEQILAQKAVAAASPAMVVAGLVPANPQCFHKTLHDNLFWPGFKGRIEQVEPGERMVSRYVTIDTYRGRFAIELPGARKEKE